MPKFLPELQFTLQAFSVWCFECLALGDDLPPPFDTKRLAKVA